MAKSNTLENYWGGLDIMTWLRLNLAASTSRKHDHCKHWSTWMWRIKISANILLRTICHGMATVYVFGTRSKCMRCLRCLSISHFSITHLKPPRQSSLFSRKRKPVQLGFWKYMTAHFGSFIKQLQDGQGERLHEVIAANSRCPPRSSRKVPSRTRHLNKATAAQPKHFELPWLPLLVGSLANPKPAFPNCISECGRPVANV